MSRGSGPRSWTPSARGAATRRSARSTPASRTDRSIDRSTVYRTLHLFLELGVVLAADTGGSETVYEIVKPRPHHHLVCRDCGREEEVGEGALRALAGQVEREHGFRAETDHLVLFGRCMECR